MDYNEIKLTLLKGIYIAAVLRRPCMEGIGDVGSAAWALVNEHSGLRAIDQK